MLSPFPLALPQLTSCSLVPSLARVNILSISVSTTGHCCPWPREGSPPMGTAGSGWRSFSSCGTFVFPHVVPQKGCFAARNASSASFPQVAQASICFLLHSTIFLLPPPQSQKAWKIREFMTLSLIQHLPSCRPKILHCQYQFPKDWATHTNFIPACTVYHKT